jgi:flagellar L-ring protein precursor FlgH
MRSATRIWVIGALGVAAAAASADSLWPASGATGGHWFADTKARRVGDMVTILIKEESTATTDVSQTHDKQTEGEYIIEKLRGLCGISKPKEGAAADEKGLPEAKWNSSRTYDAKSKAESKEALELRIGAVVKEILPNGNLLIEGRREIRHDEDVRLVHICGLVRPADVAADNTVLSQYISEAKISYETSGPSAKTKNKGWGGRILDSIWPF